MRTQRHGNEDRVSGWRRNQDREMNPASQRLSLLPQRPTLIIGSSAIVTLSLLLLLHFFPLVVPGLYHRRLRLCCTC